MESITTTNELRERFHSSLMSLFKDVVTDSTHGAVTIQRPIPYNNADINAVFVKRYTRVFTVGQDIKERGARSMPLFNKQMLMNLTQGNNAKALLNLLQLDELLVLQPMMPHQGVLGLLSQHNIVKSSDINTILSLVTDITSESSTAFSFTAKIPILVVATISKKGAVQGLGVAGRETEFPEIIRLIADNDSFHTYNVYYPALAARCSHAMGQYVRVLRDSKTGDSSTKPAMLFHKQLTPFNITRSNTIEMFTLQMSINFAKESKLRYESNPKKQLGVIGQDIIAKFQLLCASPATIAGEFSGMNWDDAQEETQRGALKPYDLPVWNIRILPKTDSAVSTYSERIINKLMGYQRRIDGFISESTASRQSEVGSTMECFLYFTALIKDIESRDEFFNKRAELTAKPTVLYETDRFLKGAHVNSLLVMMMTSLVFKTMSIVDVSRMLIGFKNYVKTSWEKKTPLMHVEPVVTTNHCLLAQYLSSLNCYILTIRKIELIMACLADNTIDIEPSRFVEELLSSPYFSETSPSEMLEESANKFRFNSKEIQLSDALKTMIQEDNSFEYQKPIAPIIPNDVFRNINNIPSAEILDGRYKEFLVGSPFLKYFEERDIFTFPEMTDKSMYDEEALLHITKEKTLNLIAMKQKIDAGDKSLENEFVTEQQTLEAYKAKLSSRRQLERDMVVFRTINGLFGDETDDPLKATEDASLGLFLAWYSPIDVEWDGHKYVLLSRMRTDKSDVDPFPGSAGVQNVSNDWKACWAKAKLKACSIRQKSKHLSQDEKKATILALLNYHKEMLEHEGMETVEFINCMKYGHIMRNIILVYCADTYLRLSKKWILDAEPVRHRLVKNIVNTGYKLCNIQGKQNTYDCTEKENTFIANLNEFSAALRKLEIEYSGRKSLALKFSEAMFLDGSPSSDGLSAQMKFINIVMDNIYENKRASKYCWKWIEILPDSELKKPLSDMFMGIVMVKPGQYITVVVERKSILSVVSVQETRKCITNIQRDKGSFVLLTRHFVGK